MTRIAKNISANFIASAISAVLAVLLTPVYVRYLGVESYGLIGFYTSWTAMAGIIDTGISATMVRQVAWLDARADGRESIPTMIRTLEVVYWAAIGTIGLTIFLAASQVGGTWFAAQQLDSHVVRAALMLMALSLIVQLPSGMYIAGLAGLQRQVESASIVAACGVFRAVGTLAVLVWISADIRAFFSWQIVAGALQTVISRWRLTRATTGHAATFSMPMLRSIWTFAGGMMLVSALSIVVTQADKLMLTRFVSLEILGFYMVASTVASGLTRLAIPLIQAFGPRFTELCAIGDDDRVRETFHRASRLLSATLLPPAAFLVLLAEPVLTAWLRNPRIAASSASFTSLLVAGTVFSVSGYPALGILYSKNLMRKVVLITACSAAIVLPALFFAIQHFGATGAAWSWLVYGAVTYLSYELCALREMQHRRPVSAILRDFALPCLISFAIAWTITYWHRQSAQMPVLGLLGIGLLTAWLTTLLTCTEIRKRVGTFGWNAAMIR